jgi:membrane-bound serine protease (ClpP class)
MFYANKLITFAFLFIISFVCVYAEDANLQTRLEEYIKFDPSGPNEIGLIQINEKNAEINQATWIYIKKAAEYYKKVKPKFIILELNTPGGELFVAQKISDQLKSLDTQDNIPVVAFINNWAISAGAMIAYSCRFITVVKDGAMGAAEPITIGESGQMTTASEKVNSAVRADFANRASFFDRNPYIAEAMVDKDIILVLREGKIIKLDAEDQIIKTGSSPDVLVSPKGKLLTLRAEQLIEYGVADILLPPLKLEPVTQDELAKGSWPASKNLLFHAPFFDKIPQATIHMYQMDWKTQFFVWLANPVINSLLVLGMMLGFYIEFNHPGAGLPGSIAVACLSLIVMSSFSQEIGNMLELVLLIVGLAFVAIDIFWIPTFGLLGIIGAVFFIAGLVGLMLPGIENVNYEFDTKTFNAAGETFVQHLSWLAGTFLLALGIMLLLGRYVMPSLHRFSRLMLVGNEQSAKDGYVAGPDPKSLPQPGVKGQVIATLRPGGKIMIDDTIYDALSEGEYLEKGTSIVISRIDGNIIVVDKQEGEE